MMKALSDYEAYNNCYHFVGSTKYRKLMFSEEIIRDRLNEIILQSLEKQGVEVIAIAVAYNHVHVLLRTELSISKVAQTLFGVSSMKLRKEFPMLVDMSPKAMWGGRSWRAIKDRKHLDNCISYINRHLPDNTKMEADCEI